MKQERPAISMYEQSSMEFDNTLGDESVQSPTLRTPFEHRGSETAEAMNRTGGFEIIQTGAFINK